MKNFLCVLFCAILFSGVAVHSGEPMRVQNFEGGAYIGFSGPMFGLSGYNRKLAIDFGAELRYNLKKVPVSVGVFAETYYPDRKFRDPDTPFSFQNNGGGLYGIVGEYDFRRGKLFNPYVSLGLGLGNLHKIGEDTRCVPALKLRAGIEVVHHIRLSASVIFSQRDFCGFNAHIGFVIGGRPKKTQ